MLGDRVVHGLGAHPPQAHVRAGDDRQRPREAPAVAVEHGQRPQIDGMLAHAGFDVVGVAHERGAAVMVDDALRIARGAGCVVERDGVPFVGWHPPDELGVAGGEHRLVVVGRKLLAGLRKLGVVVVDDGGFGLRQHQGRLRQRGELAVGDQQLGISVVELEGDDRSVEPGVDGVQHGADHGHAVVRLEHRRRVGEQHRHRVARTDAARYQPRRQPAATLVELRVREALVAVDDGGVIGEDQRRALQELEGRQRLVVGRVFVEVLVVGISGHVRPALEERVCSEISAVSAKR